MHTLRPLSTPALVILFAIGGTSIASPRCDGSQWPGSRPAVNLRLDNDLLGNGRQDQGYTNGAVITFVSPNLVDYTNDPCLPRLARWLNTWIPGLDTRSPDQRNMVVSIGQSLFTPKDWSASELIADDRPYAAIVATRFGYNVRDDDALHTTQILLGLIGPWALGEQIQDAVHEAIGDDKFSGWDHQLGNEPIVGLVHERMRKRILATSPDGRFSVDVIGHAGGSIGNAFTYANAGAELRFGLALPDDFGSTPLRPAGENTAPSNTMRYRQPSFHAFITSDVRAVARDITLDGNTFRTSHDVDRRPLVGDLGYGLVVTYASWKFAFARYFRSREFDGQEDSPRFGSFTISRSL